MKNAEIADQRRRELPAGPPWYETITGSLPEWFLGSDTLIGSVRPSRALIAVMLVSIAGNSLSDGRASFRSAAGLPVFASTAQASVDERGVDQSAMKRLPSSEKSETKPSPCGIVTWARGFDVSAATRRISARFAAAIDRASASTTFATAIPGTLAT